MSPRAAWRLEAVGFEHVADYVGGKADWLGHGLPREGANADVPYAGDLVDREPPTCRLSDSLGRLTELLSESRDGFCLVLNEQRVVLGRVRKTALDDSDKTASAESVMEAGPSTVRPNTPAREFIERLSKAELKTAIITTPGGRLIGVFHRADAEHQLRRCSPSCWGSRSWSTSRCGLGTGRRAHRCPAAR